MKTIRWKVRPMAESRGITTASQLAEVADVNKNTAGPLWNGTALRIDRETLRKLCKALQCDPGDLLEYAEGNHIAGLVRAGA